MGTVNPVLQDHLCSIFKVPEIKINACFPFKAYMRGIIESPVYRRGHKKKKSTVVSVAVLNISLAVL